MTRAASFDLLLGIVALAAIGAAALRTARAPLVASLSAAAAPEVAEPAKPAHPPLQNDRQTRSIFRIGASAEFVADAEIPVAQPRTLPSLDVRAIVGGPPWSALVSGWPGTSAPRVVRMGDRVDSLVVVTIDAGRVRFIWSDTTWTVSMPSVRR